MGLMGMVGEDECFLLWIMYHVSCIVCVCLSVCERVCVRERERERLSDCIGGLYWTTLTYCPGLCIHGCVTISFSFNFSSFTFLFFSFSFYFPSSFS